MANLNGANRQVFTIESVRRNQEMVALEEAYDAILRAMTDEELEVLINYSCPEEMPPDFLDRWGADLEKVGQLEIEFVQKWGDFEV